MSIGVSVGLCSAMGLLFGSAHMTLPFLLLGKNNYIVRNQDISLIDIND